MSRELRQPARILEVSPYKLLVHNVPSRVQPAHQPLTSECTFLSLASKRTLFTIVSSLTVLLRYWLKGKSLELLPDEVKYITSFVTGIPFHYFLIKKCSVITVVDYPVIDY